MPKQHLGDIVKLDDNTSTERITGIKNASILIKEGDGQLLPGDIDCMLKGNRHNALPHWGRAMVTYGYSDFFRLLTVAYEYI